VAALKAARAPTVLPELDELGALVELIVGHSGT
jgi:hypothetical protein